MTELDNIKDRIFTAGENAFKRRFHTASNTADHQIQTVSLLRVSNQITSPSVNL